MLGYEFEGVAGYVENKQETWCQQQKKERHSFGECRSKYVSSCEDLSVYVLLLKHVVNTYFHATIKFSIESTSAVVLHFAYGTI